MSSSCTSRTAGVVTLLFVLSFALLAGTNGSAPASAAAKSSMQAVDHAKMSEVRAGPVGRVAWRSSGAVRWARRRQARARAGVAWCSGAGPHRCAPRGLGVVACWPVLLLAGCRAGSPVAPGSATND